MALRPSAVLFLLALLSPSASASVLYGVTPVGALPGTSGSHGSGINDLGQITGYSGFGLGDTAVSAFLYTPGQAVVDLGALLGLPNTQGNGIDNAGQVVGSYSVNGDPNDPYSIQTRTFVYTPGSGSITLGTLGGNQTVGLAINNLGQVAGYGALPRVTIPEVPNHAFVYTPGLGLMDIGASLGPSSGATSINNLGQAAGGSGTAFVYTPGQAPLDLGAFGGVSSEADGINDLGQVVGDYVPDANSGPRAFLFTPGFGFVDIGSYGTYSYAFDVNNSGQAVGLFALSGIVVHAFIYSGGTTTDLNDLIDPALGITLYDARGINERGQIVANSTQGQVYLLTPVPEPFSVLLFASGLLAIAAWTRPILGAWKRSTNGPPRLRPRTTSTL